MSDARQKLIEVTERLLESKGIAKITTRLIAREAGVAEGLIYHYFKDKAELIHEVIEQHIDDLREVFEKLPASVGLNTVVDNLEKVMLVTYKTQYGLTPIITSVFADANLRERIREMIDMKRKGPRKEIEAIAIYISAEQRIGRINTVINPYIVAKLLIAYCSRSAMDDCFVGLDPERNEAKKEMKGIIHTLMNGLEPKDKKIAIKKKERVEE